MIYLIYILNYVNVKVSSKKGGFCVFFRDLVVCNKDWEGTSELVIISSDPYDVASMAARAARSVFGDRQVLWFRDNVVILL